jgi:DNA-directed RNA polymerase subunit omega
MGAGGGSTLAPLLQPHASVARVPGGARRYDDYVIYPRIDKLLATVPDRYGLVLVAAKRARQINNYHHQLGEGTFEDFPPPLVESRSKNYLTIALEEVAEGKIKHEYKR